MTLPGVNTPGVVDYDLIHRAEPRVKFSSDARRHFCIEVTFHWMLVGGS